jgi:hypothetical protein
MVELIVLAVSLAASAASAYVSSEQQEQAAENNYLIGQNNALTQKQNTELAIGHQRLANEQGYDDAKFNFQMAELNAKARSRNADRLRLFADAKTKEGRLAMRRQKRVFEAFNSKQKAAVGASGIEFSGSALDVLAESTGQMQMALQDMASQANYQRDDNLNRANDEAFGAASDSARARAGMASAQRTYDLNEGASQLGILSASSNYNASIFQASVNLSSGLGAANATRTKAAISMAGSAVGSYAKSSSTAAPAPYASATPSGGSSQQSIWRYEGVR